MSRINIKQNTKDLSVCNIFWHLWCSNDLTHLYRRPNSNPVLDPDTQQSRMSTIKSIIKTLEQRCQWLLIIFSIKQFSIKHFFSTLLLMLNIFFFLSLWKYLISRGRSIKYVHKILQKPDIFNPLVRTCVY